MAAKAMARTARSRSAEGATMAALLPPSSRIARAYENENASGRQTDFSFGNVAGGRDDLLFQLGAILNYAPPPFLNPFVNTVLNFSASATYNRNYSTLSTAAWHGFIVLPTLTLAFQPTK
jgi:hypothetical protein